MTTNQDPRTDAAWLAGLPLPALHALRAVAVENTLNLVGDGTMDDLAAEMECNYAIYAEITRRTSAR